MNPTHGPCSERADDALLVSRDQPGKDAGGAGGFGQFRLAHLLDLGAEQKMLHRYAHFLADVGSDDLIIARQDLDVHVQAVKALQRLYSGVLGGSRKARKPRRIRSDSSLIE